MEPERPAGPGSSAARRAWQAQGHTSVGARYAVIITRHPTDSEQPAVFVDDGDQDAHTTRVRPPPEPARRSTAVLRSVGGPQRVQLPTQRHRNRHLALRPGRRHGTMTTTMWRTLRLLPPAHLWTVVNTRVDPLLRTPGGGAPDARRRLGNGRCCRRDGFSDGCPRVHARADVGAQATA